jgi:diguanylate cyclase (GGDEF)-like protein
VRVPRIVPSEAFTFGLLAGIGRLALASIHPEKYAELLEQVTVGDSLGLARIEREAFGLDHGELGAAMFEDWKLPPEYVQAVLACAESPGDKGLDPAAERMVSVFHGARALADALMTTDGDSVALCRSRGERLAALRANFALSIEEFDQLWSQVASDWREWGKLMNIDANCETTPRRLLQLAERAENRQDKVAEPLDAAMEDRPIGRGETVAKPTPSLYSTNVIRSVLSPTDYETPTVMRVLVVEDDPVSRKLISFHLTKDGHQVFSAANGVEGLKLAFDRRPHMVVTDWVMPEMDGVELVRALRRTEEGRYMQVILLTGREEEARVIEAFDAGADEYLTKPLNPRILMARVRSAQRVHGLREQIDRDAKQRNSQLAELAVLNRRLHMASLTDTLTDLPNRRHAMERLQQELAQSQRDGTPLSVIMIDIDQFKSVNDEHGHDTGDVVLREVARSLRGCIRATELVCRLGGEEFLVICPRATAAKAVLIAERMRLASESNTIQHGRFSRALTLSLGVSELDRGNPSVDLMLKSADERTYMAKQAGRNRVVGAEPGNTNLLAAG